MSAAKQQRNMHRPTITLAMHPMDYERLADAAASVGYAVEGFALLALHRYSEASLAAQAKPVRADDTVTSCPSIQ